MDIATNEILTKPLICVIKPPMNPMELYNILERCNKVIRYVDTHPERCDYVALLRQDNRALCQYIFELTQAKK